MISITEEFEDVQQKVKDFLKFVAPEQVDKFLQNYVELNKELLQHRSEIQQVYDLMSDDSSKKQYLNYVKMTLVSKVNLEYAGLLFANAPKNLMGKALKTLPLLARNNGLTLPKLCALQDNKWAYCVMLVGSFGLQEYIYGDIVNVEPGDVFIDCGAYIGDTALWALQKGARVIAFEPIPFIYNILTQNITVNQYPVEECFQLGVSERAEIQTLYFSETKTSASFQKREHFTSFQTNLMSDNQFEEVQVQCVALDQWLPEHGIEPTFIKMDIEGAEISALKGTQETIKKFKPKLAICLYHSDADLWRIAHFIHSLVPEYKFYCRENEYCMSLVLYATVA